MFVPVLYSFNNEIQLLLIICKNNLFNGIFNGIISIFLVEFVFLLDS